MFPNNMPAGRPGGLHASGELLYLNRMSAWWHAVRDPSQWLDLFDVLPTVYFYTKDLEHRFRRVNVALARMHGFEPAQMEGKLDRDFHPPVLAQQYVEEDLAVMRSGEPLPDRIWLVPDANGFPRWFLSSKFPLRDAGGSVVGIAGVMREHDMGATIEGKGHYARLTPALNHVLTHYGSGLEVEGLARLCHLSVSQFQREFRTLFGCTPSEYVLGVRLLVARSRLTRTEAPVGDIALECGFYDQSHFTRAFRKATGVTPLQFRTGSWRVFQPGAAGSE
jgi:PAS domain S-box-containing protein